MEHIEELLQRVLREAKAGNTDFCVLVESLQSPDCWLQLTWEYVNAAYPFEDAPLERARAAGVREYAGCAVESWQPKTYATFEHPTEPTSQIAEFIQDDLEKVLRVSAAEDALQVEEQQL